LFQTRHPATLVRAVVELADKIQTRVGGMRATGAGNRWLHKKDQPPLANYVSVPPPPKNKLLGHMSKCPLRYL